MALDLKYFASPSKLPTAYCQLSTVNCQLSSVFCLLSSVFCLLSSVFCLLPFHALARFDYNPNCQQAMQAVLDLKIKDARFLIDVEKKSNPDNGYVVYLEHYADAIELIVTEEVMVYDRLIDNYESRIDRMNELDDGSPDNKWLQAEILFQTGLAQIKFGSRISGATKLLSAYRKIKDHRQKYPDFWQNRKLTGIFNIILDYIPPFMRWAADMFGFSGNAELGLYQLRQYCLDAGKTPGLREEAVLITSLGYKLTWKDQEGFAFLSELDVELQKGTLIKYLLASSATYTYQNDLALKLLTEIHQDELQVNFYSLYYVTGRCKLNHLEPDAPVYLKKYLDEYPGPDYKKDICNRLAYHYLINGDPAKFREYRAMISAVGQDLRDRDQEALLESRSGVVPHVGLLKARLLCDGGYFDEARGIMRSINESTLAEPAYRLEYHYRLGRIMQLSGRSEEAVPELARAYNEGKSAPYTFATRAALQLGKIYEEKKEIETAIRWYECCIDAYSSSHTTEGVKDMAAKALKRLE